MKNGFIAFLLMLPLSGFSQTSVGVEYPVITPDKYSWILPAEARGKNLKAGKIFEGSTHDMEYMLMEACALVASKSKTKVQVPPDEEHLLIFKSGVVQVSFGDSSWSLGGGSIALLMPAQNYSLQNNGQDPGLYYLMKYRARSGSDMERGKASGGSFVKDWTKIPFRKHDRGGVRHYFEIPTAMCKRFEMHVTTLNPGLKSHAPHTHAAEEIILMMEDTAGQNSRTEMLIGDKFFNGESGDLYYVGSNLLHGIRNEGQSQCAYFAFQFE